jgi:hypothetical protein
MIANNKIRGQRRNLPILDDAIPTNQKHYVKLVKLYSVSPLYVNLFL